MFLADLSPVPARIPHLLCVCYIFPAFVTPLL
jgi:hypothetical protein